jgi:redox-sensitive bicupin YhaK (pirin superfamily)
VTTFVETSYIDFDVKAGADFLLPATASERAIYVVSGDVLLDNEPIAPLHMAQLPNTETCISAESDARLVLVGGAPLDAHRFIWWNFVSSRQERIEQAKLDWKEKRFAPIPGDDAEFIPLPE